ncbi:MAG: methylisocitrate lyase, partial [Rhodospirillales bacterium]|nr:methylisocitrate lyase [Rhodospirillales bacterium]
REAIDAPLLANMTEFGKTPLYSLKELENFGFNIAIYPVSSLRIALGAIEDSFSILKEKGSLISQVDKMQTRKRLYEILKYEEYNQFDNDLYNFKL